MGAGCRHQSDVPLAGTSSSWPRCLLRRALLSAASTPGAPFALSPRSSQARGLGGSVFAWAQVRDARAYGGVGHRLTAATGLPQ